MVLMAEEKVTENAWRSLRVAWRRYKQAKQRCDREDMLRAANRIRELQLKLGLVQARFPDLGIN